MREATRRLRVEGLSKQLPTNEVDFEKFLKDNRLERDRSPSKR